MDIEGACARQFGAQAGGDFREEHMGLIEDLSGGCRGDGFVRGSWDGGCLVGGCGEEQREGGEERGGEGAKGGRHGHGAGGEGGRGLSRL